MSGDQLLDLSAYQGTVNFAQLRLAGIKGVLIRCCVDDSAADPFFAYNWSQAKANGLARIAYLYAKPGTDTPETQADHAMAIVEPDFGPNDGIALDLEEGSGDLALFAVLVGRRWKENYPNNKRLLYSSLSFLESNLNVPEAGLLFDLWVAEWNSAISAPGVPSAWAEKGWQIWQYTDIGQVPGVSGHVDRDICNGSIDAYLGGGQTSLPIPAPAPSPPAPVNPAPIVGPSGGQVIVKSGDTMSGIADEHGVSLNELEAANPQIKDYSLIFPGEIIFLPGSLVPTKPANAEVYIVHPGDTMSSIAKAYGRDLGAVERANPQIPNPNLIYAGQPVFIPPGPTYTNPNPRVQPPAPVRRTVVVHSGDTMSGIAQRFGVPLAALEAANRGLVPNPSLIYPGQILTIP